MVCILLYLLKIFRPDGGRVEGKIYMRIKLRSPVVGLKCCLLFVIRKIRIRVTINPCVDLLPWTHVQMMENRVIFLVTLFLYDDIFNGIKRD